MILEELRKPWEYNNGWNQHIGAAADRCEEEEEDILDEVIIYVARKVIRKSSCGMRGLTLQEASKDHSVLLATNQDILRPESKSCYSWVAPTNQTHNRCNISCLSYSFALKLKAVVPL